MIHPFAAEELAMAEHKAHPANVSGDYYVEDGCCSMCNVPLSEAPELFGVYRDPTKGFLHCYVKRQPESASEREQMFRAIRCAELHCIRYRGSDKTTQLRLVEVGDGPNCDNLPPDLHERSQQVQAALAKRDVVKEIRELFERYVPEIASGAVQIMAIARDAGFRAKVAVHAHPEVDAVRACVGPGDTRIAKIVEHVGHERVDIVRWDESLQVLIRRALGPAQIDDVFLYPRLGRAIALLKEDQLPLAIGRRGDNVRQASKLVCWDIELMTFEELKKCIENADNWFRQIPGFADRLVELFILEGFLTYDDLTFLEPAQLAELAAVTEEEAAAIVSVGSPSPNKGTWIEPLQTIAWPFGSSPTSQNRTRPAARPTSRRANRRRQQRTSEELRNLPMRRSRRC
jgi:transcription antitermination factor NusA-like protein